MLDWFLLSPQVIKLRYKKNEIRNGAVYLNNGEMRVVSDFKLDIEKNRSVKIDGYSIGILGKIRKIGEIINCYGNMYTYAVESYVINRANFNFNRKDKIKSMKLIIKNVFSDRSPWSEIKEESDDNLEIKIKRATGVDLVNPTYKNLNRIENLLIIEISFINGISKSEVIKYEQIMESYFSVLTNTIVHSLETSVCMDNNTLCFLMTRDRTKDIDKAIVFDNMAERFDNNLIKDMIKYIKNFENIENFVNNFGRILKERRWSDILGTIDVISYSTMTDEDKERYEKRGKEYEAFLKGLDFSCVNRELRSFIENGKDHFIDKNLSFVAKLENVCNYCGVEIKEDKYDEDEDSFVTVLFKRRDWINKKEAEELGKFRNDFMHGRLCRAEYEIREGEDFGGNVRMVTRTTKDILTDMIRGCIIRFATEKGSKKDKELSEKVTV